MKETKLLPDENQGFNTSKLLPWICRNAIAIILLISLLRGVIFAFGAFPLLHHDEPANFIYVGHFLYHTNLPVNHMPGVPSHNLHYPEDQPDPQVVKMISTLPKADIVRENKIDNTGKEMWTYEFVQAPLYYAIPGFLLRPIRDHLFALMYLVRIYSVILNLITVYIAYRSLKLIFTSDQRIVLCITFFIAMIPEFGYDGASINTSNLINLSYALIFYILLRIIRKPNFDRYGLWLGLATGMAILTKITIISGLATIFTLLAFLFFQRSQREVLRRFAGWLGLSLAFGGWLFVRNYIIYGDLWGFKENFAFYQKYDDQLNITGFPIWTFTTFATFWLDLHTNVYTPLLSIFPFFLIVIFFATLLSSFGLIRYCLQSIRVEGKNFLAGDKGAILVLLLSSAFFTISPIILYNITVGNQNQGRYYYSALIPLCTGLIGGLYLLKRNQNFQRFILTTISGFMLLFTFLTCMYIISLNIG